MQTAEVESVHKIFHSSLSQKMMHVRVSQFHYPFNFVIEIIMEIALSSCENSDTEAYSSGDLPELEYASGVVLLSRDSFKLPVLLDCLNNSTGRFGMHSALFDCKTMLQHWVHLKPNLILVEEELG